MNDCERIEELLNDYVDGYLPNAQRSKVEAHLVDCEGCRGDVQAIRRLVEEAGALAGNIEPERDLWPGIADRIAAKEKTVTINFTRRPSLRMPVLRYALVAAAMVLIVLGVASLNRALVFEPISAPVAVVDEEFQRIEGEYLKARDELRVALDARRDSLDPEMLAIVEANLRDMEEAVTSINLALVDKPGHEGFERMLHAALRGEVALLRHALELDDEGLADIRQETPEEGHDEIHL